MNNLEVDTFDKFIIIGDRVLIKPKSSSTKTKSGLYLPPGVEEKEKVQSGYVIKLGPGYPLPVPSDGDDFWKEKKEQVHYMPLQAQEGDLAVYLQNAGHEIQFNNEKYVIVPQGAILMLIRDESLFD